MPAAPPTRPATLAVAPGLAAVRLIVGQDVAGAADLTDAFADGPETLAQAVADAGVTAVGIALPGDLVTTATLGAADLPAKDRRAFLLGRFEDATGVDADSVLIDFLGPADAPRVLAVAADRRPWAEVVAALRAAGVRVTTLAPTALLATNALATAADVLLLGDGSGGVEVLGRGGTWRTASTDAADNRLALILGQLAGDGTLAVAASPADVRWNDVADLPAVGSVQQLELSPTEAAANVIAVGGPFPCDLLGHGSAGGDGGTPWVKLAYAAAAALLLVAIGGGVLAWRAADAQAAALAEQEAVYRAVVPDGPLPPNVPAKLRALARDEAGGSADVLVELRSLLARLPGEPDSRITQIELSDAGLTLGGEASDVRAADGLKDALGTVGQRLTVQNLDRTDTGSVAFQIVGGGR